MYPTIETASSDQLRRKEVLDRILECRPVTWQTFDNSDIAFIKVMRFCMVPNEDIYKMYTHVTRYQVGNAFRNKEVDFYQVDPIHLGVSPDDYALFAKMCEDINLKNSENCDII